MSKQVHPRFTNSKCDRCGKTTKAMQNGEHDLFVLPHEWGAPLADQGSFCEPCIDRYSLDEWLTWFLENRMNTHERIHYWRRKQVQAERGLDGVYQSMKPGTRIGYNHGGRERVIELVEVTRGRFYVRNIKNGFMYLMDPDKFDRIIEEPA